MAARRHARPARVSRIADSAKVVIMGCALLVSGLWLDMRMGLVHVDTRRGFSVVIGIDCVGNVGYRFAHDPQNSYVHTGPLVDICQ